MKEFEFNCIQKSIVNDIIVSELKIEFLNFNFKLESEIESEIAESIILKLFRVAAFTDTILAQIGKAKKINKLLDDERLIIDSYILKLKIDENYFIDLISTKILDLEEDLIKKVREIKKDIDIFNKKHNYYSENAIFLLSRNLFERKSLLYSFYFKPAMDKIYKKYIIESLSKPISKQRKYLL